MKKSMSNFRRWAGLAAAFVLFAADRASAQDDQVHYYTIGPDRAVVSKVVKSEQSEALVSDVQCSDRETRVEVSVPMRSDGHWLCFSPGMLIRDCDNGQTVYLKEIAGGFPMDRVLLVQGMEGKMVNFTLIFPPLRPGTRQIEIMEDMQKSVPTPDNGTPWYWKIDLANYSQAAPVVYGKPVPVTISRVERPKCRYVTRLVPIVGTSRSQLLKKVEVTEKGTVVTVRTRHGKPGWGVGADTRIIDCATGDIYPALTLNKRLQLGRRYRKLSRARQVKVYFPALTSKVRKIDIIEGNGDSRWKWENIHIKNY